MNHTRATEIANFRYNLIAPIVSRLELNPGETQKLLLEAAKKHYQIPYSTKTTISKRTIERYLSSYREGGYDALIPKYATGKQAARRIPTEYLELAAALKRESMKRPVLQIIDTLEKSGRVPKGVLKKSTVYDYFVKQGINKDKAAKEAKAYQRFTPKKRNERWQGDTCHLLYLPDSNNPGKSRKVYLIAWLDEFSRLITHAQCYFKEASYTLEDCLKKAIIKYGVPNQIYCDNGAVFSSKQLNAVCGRLGMKLSHTRPYRPQGRGKIERLFDTIQTSFLSEIEAILKTCTLSLEELNDYLFIWVNRHYHEKTHSATKQKPIASFESDPTPLRIVDLQELEDAFLLEDTRTVDKTCHFKLAGLEFAVVPELVRTKIMVRYNPHDLTIVQVYHNNKRFPDAQPMQIPEHIDFTRTNGNEQSPEIQPTGLNYLDYLKKDQQEGLSYASFPSGGDS